MEDQPTEQTLLTFGVDLDKGHKIFFFLPFFNIAWLRLFFAYTISGLASKSEYSLMWIQMTIWM